MTQNFQYQRLAVPIAPVVVSGTVIGWQTADDKTPIRKIVRRFKPESVSCSPVVVFNTIVSLTPRAQLNQNIPVPRQLRSAAWQQREYVGPSVVVLPAPLPTTNFPAGEPLPIRGRRFTTADQLSYAGPFQTALPLPGSAPLFVSSPPQQWVFRRFSTADQQPYAAPAFPTLPLPTVALVTAADPFPLRRRWAWHVDAFAGMPPSTVIAPLMSFVSATDVARRRLRQQPDAGLASFQQTFQPPLLSWTASAWHPTRGRRPLIDTPLTSITAPPQQRPELIPLTVNEVPARLRLRVQPGHSGGVSTIVTTNEPGKAATYCANALPFRTHRRDTTPPLDVTYPWYATTPPGPAVFVVNVSGAESLTAALSGVESRTAALSGVESRTTALSGGPTMATVDQPVEIQRWQAKTLVMTMVPATSIATWTFSLNIRLNGTAAIAPITTFITIDGTNGIVSFGLTSAQTGALSVADYDFDIWRTNAGFEEQLVKGPLVVTAQQWKD
jgi:hypothetical protein